MGNYKILFKCTKLCLSSSCESKLGFCISLKFVWSLDIRCFSGSRTQKNACSMALKRPMVNEYYLVNYGSIFIERHTKIHRKIQIKTFAPSNLRLL